MATSVRSLLGLCDLSPGGSVKWGTRPDFSGKGVYIVSTASDVDRAVPVYETAPIADDAVAELIRRCSGMTVDGRRPSTAELQQRLAGMWLPDEVVLYIGKATSVRPRVAQYYSTLLGARRPHRGGWALKTLSILGELYVHWSPTSNPELYEMKLLTAFVASVSEDSRMHLVDPAHPFPFANLEGPGGRKKHGIRGAAGCSQDGGSNGTSSRSPLPPASSSSGCGPSQRVTPSDIAAGRIRFPREAKTCFPAVPDRVTILLRGERRVDIAWDPRLGPDRERSGVLSVGREILGRLVAPEERLSVSKGTDGEIVLD